MLKTCGLSAAGFNAFYFMKNDNLRRDVIVFVKIIYCK